MAEQREIVEVLLKELLPGDIRKINYDSNDASTGGGARDFRFPLKWASVLSRMFPRAINEKERMGDLTYCDNNDRVHTVQNIVFHPIPTLSRPNEVRIAKIGEIPIFQAIPDELDTERVFITLARYSDGIVQAGYTKESAIRSVKSDRLILSAMEKAIDATKSGSAVIFSVHFAEPRNFEER